MKILLISKWVAGSTRGDFFYPGVWRDTFELALCLAKQKLEVAILTPKVRPEHKLRFAHEFGSLLKKKKIKHFIAPMYVAFASNWGLFRLKFFLAELQALRSFSPHIVQYMQFGPSLIYPWLKKTPLIFYSCYLFKPYPNEKEDLLAKRLDWGVSPTLLDHICFSLCNLVYLLLSYIVGAMTIKQIAKRGATLVFMHKKGYQKAKVEIGNLTKVLYIPKGIEMPKESNKLARLLNPPKYKILFIGAILFGKGIFDLLEALRVLQKKLPQARLTIVGTGPSSLVKQMLAIIHRYHLNVRYSGSRNYRQKWELYFKHTVFCLPSYSDAYPSVVLEAMAVGLPVVTTDQIDSPIVQNQSGFIVPVGNIKALSEALYKLLTDTNLCKKMGRDATYQVKKYSWVSASRQFSQLYRKLT